MDQSLALPRYWYSREKEFDLSSLGFLADPDGKYGSIFAAGAVTLAALRDHPFLVLIGEPGTGKTTEFERNFRPVDGREVCYINLRTASSEDSLRHLFQVHRQIQRWKSEGGTLELLLDSYDESPINNLAYVLQSLISDLKPRTKGEQPPMEKVRFQGEDSEQTNTIELQDNAKSYNSLLFVRVACRMGAYDSFLGETIKDGLSVKVEEPFEYKLAPLREVDARALIAAHVADPDQFLKEAQRLSISFLAAKPITLDLLLRSYNEEKKLGESAVEVYERGVRSLCEEPSRYRKVSLNSRPDITRRLQTARQAAGLMILCGYTDLWLENDTECPNNDLLAVGEIALNGIGENDVRDLANTALLVPMSTGQFAWAHKTIAEYLAGSYLVESKLSAAQIKNLIVDSESNKVFPQFRETAAWVASMHDEFRRWMIVSEPETILASDVALFAASDKEQIVERLLTALDREELFTIESDASHKFDRLNYVGLGSQLRPWILDRNKTIFVRREAIEIAEACRIEELEEDLVRIALNSQEDANARISAAHAVVHFGSKESKHRLRPLVNEGDETDADAELRGIGLSACWPDGITILDTLNAVERPRSGRVVGSLWGFVSRDFSEGFRQEFLYDSLIWLLRNDRRKERNGREFGVTGFLFAEAWKRVEEPIVRDLLARLWIRRAKRYQKPFKFDDNYLQPEDISLDVSKRRLFAEAVVRLSKGNEQVIFSLGHSEHEWLNSADVEWVWEHVFIGSPIDRRKWADLAFWLPPDPEVIKHGAEIEPAVAKAFASRLSITPSESRRATFYRQREEREKLQEEKRQVEALKANIPKRLNDLFDQALDQPEKLWCLHRELIFNVEAAGAQPDWVQPDVRRLPGWGLLTDDRKSRWTEVSKAYLAAQSAVNEGWKPQTIHHPDVAGYRSFRWLIENDPSFFSEEDTDLYHRWASAVVFMTNQLWENEAESDQALLKLFYRRVPLSIRKWMGVLLKRESVASNDSMVFRRFNAIWDDELGELYLSFGRARTKQAGFKYDLLHKLVAKGFSPAAEYAKRQLRGNHGIGEARKLRRTAMVKALLEASDASWSFVLPFLWDDLTLAESAIGEFIHGKRDENLSLIHSSIGLNGLGELYELLLNIYPTKDGEQLPEGFMGARESAIWFRDSIPRYLAGLGTTDSLLELLRLKNAHPNLFVLKWHILSARRQLRRAKWLAPKPATIIELIETSEGRLVNNGDQLLEVVMDALAIIGEKMIDRGECQFYWHEPITKGDAISLRPKDENTLSSFIAARLEDRLEHQGIVINREVEVRPGNKTDIYVTAFSRRKDAFEPITVVIETKGCWHAELGSAMETQLLGQYLAVPKRNHGIYLVGWFDCDAWGGPDRRKSACRRAANSLSTDFFESQASSLSSGSKILRYLSLDCRYYRRASACRKPSPS